MRLADTAWILLIAGSLACRSTQPQSSGPATATAGPSGLEVVTILAMGLE
ncbi:MAG TPA: hypothetical protein VMS76_18975 [Planctomycetota bacterium]|nr:hypothetical protein [Planctomycetota bacterium]